MTTARAALLAGAAACGAGPSSAPPADAAIPDAALDAAALPTGTLELAFGATRWTATNATFGPLNAGLRVHAGDATRDLGLDALQDTLGGPPQLDANDPTKLPLSVVLRSFHPDQDGNAVFTDGGVTYRTDETNRGTLTIERCTAPCVGPGSVLAGAFEFDATSGGPPIHVTGRFVAAQSF